jgi:Flp pilus assembly protein TadB
MALSDYERRVLDEIEAELRLQPARRWHLGRTVVLLAACVLVAAGVITLAAIVLPSAFAVAVASALGVAVGYLIGILWRRRSAR